MSIIDIKNYPTTRYQGSKRKILPFLHSVFSDIPFNTVLDACGGSGSVSYLFKKMGKTVTYNDLLKFNYLIGKAIIENNSITLNSEDIEYLISNHANITYNNFIERTFRGIYYTNNENRFLDKISNNILSMNNYPEEILEYKKALSYYALFQSSLVKRPFNLFHRKNLNLRTNNVERNFGNKVTWEKSFDYYINKFSAEANKLVFDNGQNCQSTNESIFDIDPYGYDLVYIDPPYIRTDGSNESSNYTNSYHFLEGLSHYNHWEEMIDFDSNNFRIQNTPDDTAFNENEIRQTIENILYNFRNSIIAFSYKKGGKPSIPFIIKKLRDLNKTVYTRSIHYTYALNHQNGDAINNREVIIIAI